MKNNHNLFLIAIISVYFVGCSQANKYVRDSCTHGNCKSGWHSKYNQEEQLIANLWIIGFPIAGYILFSKFFPKEPKNTNSSYQNHYLPSRRNDSTNKTKSNNNQKRCPKCGSYMRVRIAKKGQNIGKEFWGCSKFPKCRSIVNIGS